MILPTAKDMGEQALLLYFLKQFFFSMALLKRDPWNIPAADRDFLFFSKETFMCMDGQEQAMSDSVYWKTI